MDEAESSPVAQPGLSWLIQGVRVAAMVLLLGLCMFALYLLIGGADYRQLAAIGLPGITIIMFLSSATVLLPAPGIAAVGVAGMLAWNPLLVGLFAAIGSSAGEMTGYLLGMGGRRVLGTRNGKWWTLAEYFMRRWGFLTVLAMASIPNPFFDAVGLLAGSLRYPARKLLVAILIGNFLKYTATAMLGDATVGGLGWWRGG